MDGLLWSNRGHFVSIHDGPYYVIRDTSNFNTLDPTVNIFLSFDRQFAFVISILITGPIYPITILESPLLKHHTCLTRYVAKLYKSCTTRTFLNFIKCQGMKELLTTKSNLRSLNDFFKYYHTCKVLSMSRYNRRLAGRAQWSCFLKIKYCKNYFFLYGFALGRISEESPLTQ